MVYVNFRLNVNVQIPTESASLTSPFASQPQGDVDDDAAMLEKEIPLLQVGAPCKSSSRKIN
jgi:hypothetical protein